MLTSFIFFPEKAYLEEPGDYGFAYEEIEVPAPGGALLHGWFLKAEDPKGVVLFMHGNAGNISHRLFKVKGWVDRGFSVLLFDYRGYGKSSGKIEHERDILSDSQAALGWVLTQKNQPVSKIILYGESLGSHPAIRLACDYEAAAVILEAPFTSFVELGKLHYPLVPALSLLLKDFAFANLEWMHKLKAPLFILHGTADEVSPHEMSKRLFEKAAVPKELYSIPGGAHNNLPEVAGEGYWERPCQFVIKLTNTHK